VLRALQRAYQQDPFGTQPTTSTGLAATIGSPEWEVAFALTVLWRIPGLRVIDSEGSHFVRTVKLHEAIMGQAVSGSVETPASVTSSSSRQEDWLPNALVLEYGTHFGAEEAVRLYRGVGGQMKAEVIVERLSGAFHNSGIPEASVAEYVAV